MFDFIIKNAQMIDGGGSDARTADIAIKDGRFAQIGSIDEGAPGAQIIDARGLYAIPGFVDIHRHGDLAPVLGRETTEELMQGITNYVNGNCGFSAVPSSDAHFEELRRYAKPIIGNIPPELACLSGKNFFQRLSEQALSANTGYLIGAGALRICEKGFETGALSRKELDAVCGKLSDLIDAGALGLSMGLMYVPENFTPTEQLAEMCRVPARKGKLIAVHMRGEGSSLIASVDEIIDLARRTGGRFHISHLKAAGKRTWNDLLPRALDRIHAAQAQGVDITYDVYPYCAGSTALYTLFPPDTQDGGVAGLVEQMRNAQFRARMRSELATEHDSWDNIIASTGWQSVTIVGASDSKCIGKNIEEIAAERGVTPVDCAMDLMLENNGDVPMVIHSMSESDMELALSAPGAIVISDALYAEGGMPHPRRYGAAARAVSHYGKRFGLAKMVRACTALPAERMGLSGRGRIAVGYYADMLLLDMDRFHDRATYTDPIRLPEGIHCIFVNGRLAVSDGKLLGKYGKIL